MIIQVLQQLCYKADCATCGILAFGFDLSKSGQGSRDRGARVWQRFGDGIYFSPNSSKCHFYSKTGVSKNQSGFLRCDEGLHHRDLSFFFLFFLFFSFLLFVDLLLCGLLDVFRIQATTPQQRRTLAP